MNSPAPKNSVSLAELQQQLQDFLLDKKSLTEDITLETEQFKRAERLDIYYQGYRLRLIEVLEKDFPALKKYIGDENFSEICLAYIERYTSQHPSLRWFSQHFVQFLKQRKEAIEIIELAQFEWAQIMAFDAEECGTLDQSALKNLPPEAWMTIQLKFHPSLQLLDLFTAAPLVWQKLEKETEEINLEQPILSHSLLWTIWRKDLQILFQSCDPIEEPALKLFFDGHSLASVFETLTQSVEVENVEQLPMQIAGFIQRWIKNGMVTSLA